MSGHTRLYHHKTDGGAEYLSPVAVPGTDEGAFEGAPFTIRLDGKPEFMGPGVALIAAAPELLSILKRIIDRATAPMSDGDITLEDVAEAREIIAKAEGK